ncbi:ABC transporter ATP-binding protein [Rhizomonospora bruguierae]|uniref:ABC transporter ATP-binding protein n=1 Tax=Rhizomonospora bruguierae TaxID=1581705 RepID=UPI001BCEB12A|nr:ABC transporter ATP-binding protein [Micromonospora sp. NBRC 107566]
MISLSALSKRFPTKGNSIEREFAVDEISLDVPEGQFVTLLGPSGCGKTTTLRMIAGLERPTGGRISIDDETVYSQSSGHFVPAHARPIGMVFQSYAIWPHMTVLGNVAYPLMIRRGTKKAHAKEKAMEVLELVGLSALADRPAPDLSGGQQQRVALARALVREPRVLLLDEPLSNLDAGLRDQMGVQLRSVQRRLGITTVFVTHDQGEALAMSDLIVVMRDGKIVERGTPRDIYSSPKDAFTAGFMGVCNIVQGIVETIDRAAATVGSPLGPLSAPCGVELRTGDAVDVYLHPESLKLRATRPDSTAWRGVVKAVVYRGEHTDYAVQTGQQTMKVRLYRGSHLFEIEDEVWVTPLDGGALLVRSELVETNVSAALTA